VCPVGRSPKALISSQVAVTSHCAKGQWCGGLIGNAGFPKLGNDDRNQHSILGGGNSNIIYFHLYLGKIQILTDIFQRVGSTTNQNSKMISDDIFCSLDVYQFSP